MKLSYTRIAAKDVPALVRFYQAVTEIAPDVKSEDYVEFRTAGGTLAITSQRAVDLYGAGATRPGENRSAIIEFEVGDVDAERARLRELAPACVLEPTLQPWGNRSMLFRDPDGNLINFFTPMRGEWAQGAGGTGP
jgi:catechol 2,3-dioxygenase-like lactoylglutathione lyase family enzyme